FPGRSDACEEVRGQAAGRERPARAAPGRASGRSRSGQARLQGGARGDRRLELPAGRVAKLERRQWPGRTRFFSVRTLWTFSGEVTEPDDKEIEARLARCDRDGFWLDIQDPDEADYSLLLDVFHYHRLTVEDIQQ